MDVIIQDKGATVNAWLGGSLDLPTGTGPTVEAAIHSLKHRIIDELNNVLKKLSTEAAAR